jgi:uncharacterized protein DUF6282
MNRYAPKSRRSILSRLFFILVLPFALFVLGPSAGQAATADPDDVVIDPLRGPVDMGLTDPSLIGAIDVHLHLDPDAPGAGGVIRAIDVLDAAKIAKERGMRGFVFKTHQDTSSASGAYLARKHVTPTLEVFGRMASNYSSGGINVAALEHFSQVKGGFGRIYEMPTRDSITATTALGSMDRAMLARTRPWMLIMPEGTPAFIAVSKNGELLPEVKYLIAQLAKIRTVDTNGRMVLATGHATPEEHLLLAREGRRLGLNVIPATFRSSLKPRASAPISSSPLPPSTKRKRKARPPRRSSRRSVPSTSSFPPIAGKPPTSIRRTVSCSRRAACARTASPSASSTLCTRSIRLSCSVFRRRMKRQHRRHSAEGEGRTFEAGQSLTAHPQP